jgi:arylsulfate sulfotransferase
MRKVILALFAFAVIAGLPAAARAQAPYVTLRQSVPSPQMVGTPVLWSAVVQNPLAGHTYGYQFSVTFNSQAQIVRDFSPTSGFTWVPHTVEGAYQVSVVVRDTTTTPYVFLAPVSVNFTLTPWVTAPLTQAVNPTSHPLVALFSGPPCTAGHQLSVRFHPANSQITMTTDQVACSQQSANFLVAGMYPSTQYLMHWEEYDGNALVNTGADLPFTTGALPSDFPAPQFQVTVPATAHDAAYPIALFQLQTNPFWPTATDLSGNVLWYGPGFSMARMEAGGNYFSYGSTLSGVGSYATLTEYDLGSNAVLQTNLEILNEQLAAKGYPTIVAFNGHEARHLPDGNLLLLGSRDVASTTAQGGTPAAPVDIIGDMVLVLNPNLQLVWAWDSFAHEDITRMATLNDQCAQGAAGCPPFNTDFAVANDWLHSNFAQGTADGNIILSQRSQDWVLKINYANGTGDGSVIWHMGAGGDFTIVNPPSQSCGTPNVFPWFTHQHDAAFQFEENADASAGTIMTVFDDGNTRAAKCPAPQNSRGMVLFVNEPARQVYIETAGDLGGYSFALGSGQLLAPGDGNLYASYNNGILNPTAPKAQSTEIDLGGHIVYQLQVNNSASYRTYRMANLYAPTIPFTAAGIYATTAMPLQFGTIPLGTTEVLPLNLSNFGLPGTVTTGNSISGPGYSVLSSAQNTCTAGITAGESCSIPVEFNPSTPGNFPGLLSLNPSAGPTPAVIALDGNAGVQISGISPNYGAPAAAITISGTGFGATQGGGYVVVGDGIAEVTSWSPTSITIRVPSTASSGNLYVRASGQNSNGVSFTFYPFPTVTSVSTASGTIGSTVTITGAGLLDGGGNAAVSFNGTTAAIVSDSSGSIQVTVPTGAASGRLLVRVNGVTLVAVGDFIVPLPQVSGVSPDYGAPSALINISGNNFGANQGSGSVTVGGALSRVVSWSDTLISVTVPSNASSGNIVVMADGAASNSAAFTFYPFPDITGVSASSGEAGTVVTITGSNLLDGGGKAVVSFNGVPGAISSDTGGGIQVTVPAGASSGRLLVQVNGISIVALGDFIIIPPTS